MTPAAFAATEKKKKIRFKTSLRVNARDKSLAIKVDCAFAFNLIAIDALMLTARKQFLNNQSMKSDI